MDLGATPFPTQMNQGHVAGPAKAIKNGAEKMPNKR